MKSFAASLTLAAALCACCAQGAKVTALRDRTTAALASAPGSSGDGVWCTGNQFPLDPDGFYHAAGLMPGDDLFTEMDLQGFRSGLADGGDWLVPMNWTFRAKVNSTLAQTTVFGFLGGGGFLEVTVPANAVNETVEATGSVLSAALEAQLAYRTGPALENGDDVVFTHMCLRPKLCVEAVSCNVSGWKEKLYLNPGRAGTSMQECCDELFCTGTPEVEDCEPANLWSKKEGFDTLKGHNKERCCDPVYCDFDTVCNTPDLKAKPGTGILGNTPEQCCEPALCHEFLCQPFTKWTTINYEKDGSPRMGKTQEECCKEVFCSELDCSTAPDGRWKSHPDQENLLGNTYLECCEPQYCANLTCAPTTKWKPMANPEPNRQGHTLERCCEAIMCRDFTCESPGYEPSEVSYGTQSLELGSTDAECCTAKPCSEFHCGDNTTWAHKSALVNGSTRRGATQTECCEEIFCAAAVDCENFDGSKWSSKSASELEGLQGSTPQQCCDPNYCADFNCTTDSDGDGDGTKWYKRVDTNTHQYQGQSDEECCIPKYCTQHRTSLSLTKWKINLTDDLLGSTDGECMIPRRCVDEVEVNCTDTIADTSRLGSTSVECCW